LFFFWSYGCVVKFNQIRKHLDDVLSVVLVLTYWIIPQPKHFQMLKTLQILDVLHILNQIFAQVKFCQFAAVLEVAQSFYLIQTQTTNFYVRHVLQR